MKVNGQWQPRPDEISKIPSLGLDPSVDAPLPTWARKVVSYKGLSKNTKLHLLRLNDIMIRKGISK